MLVRMATAWADLQTAAHERRLLARGQPTIEHADIFLWDEADLTGWLDAAVHVGVRMVYADEQTFADRVDQLRLSLEELRGDFDDQFETDADDLERTLDELASRPSGESSTTRKSPPTSHGSVHTTYDTLTLPC